MSERNSDAAEPEVPVVCPECGTETRIPLEGLADAVDRHNDRLHDGREVATVDPAVAERLTDLVAADLGLVEDAD